MDLGPPPAGLPDWSARRCQGCHPAQAAAFALSGHAQARTSFVFAAALRREEPGFCLRCHAPQARSIFAPGFAPGHAPQDEDTAPLEERGVSCAACHAPAGLALRDSRLCAGCHQFGFSLRDERGALLGLSPRPQQDTYEEWRRYQRASGDTRGCVACHMPGGDHAMGGIRRIEALRRAVQVQPEPGGLRISLRDTGHRLPTGDIMRWLTLQAAADPLFEEPVPLRGFGRTLAREHGPTGSSVRVVADTSLDPLAPPLLIPLPAADAQGRPLRYFRLVYHLISPQQEQDGLLPPGLSQVVVNAAPIPVSIRSSPRTNASCRRSSARARSPTRRSRKRRNSRWFSTRVATTSCVTGRRTSSSWGGTGTGAGADAPG
jgi:hypothetical protein